MKNKPRPIDYLVWGFLAGALVITIIGIIWEDHINDQFKKQKQTQINITNFTETLDWFQKTNCDGTFFVKKDIGWTAFQQKCINGDFCKYDYIPLNKCEVRP